jgi:predicted ester cyclase
LPIAWLPVCYGGQAMARMQVFGDPAPVPFHVAPVQLETLARRYYELFNQRKLDDAERFVDPQAVFTYPLAKEHLIGRAGYRELVRRWLEGFPDARITITRVTVRDDRVVRTDWVGAGTHRGRLDLPGFPGLPATGVHTELPMRETITIGNGLIVESRMEFDPIELLRRLVGGRRIGNR